MNNTLVVYFSHKGENWYQDKLVQLDKGNAEIIAEKAQKILDADIFEIVTKKEYPNGYKQCCDVALAEQKMNELPELKNYLNDIEQYENIVLVYPCWWGTMPQCMFTFLNKYNFNSKNIYPICTHEGSKMGRSENDVKKTCKKANIKIGLPIVGTKANLCDNDLKQYLLS